MFYPFRHNTGVWQTDRVTFCDSIVRAMHSKSATSTVCRCLPVGHVIYWFPVWSSAMTGQSSTVMRTLRTLSPLLAVPNV